MRYEADFVGFSRTASENSHAGNLGLPGKTTGNEEDNGSILHRSLTEPLMPTLTEPEICEARLRYANGERMKALADYYSVTIVTMHCAIRGVRHRKYKTGNRVAPIPLGCTK